MRHSLVIFFIVIFFASCGSKVKQDSTISDTNEANEIVETESIEDFESENLSEIEEVEDGKFIKFFESFFYNRNFQKQRIKFPIQVDNSVIEKQSEWTYLPFYFNESYIPILNFDTLSYFDKDIIVDSVKMSILNFSNQKSRNYSFAKKNNQWFLNHVYSDSFENVCDYEFINFLVEFSSDSIFQFNHVVFPIERHYLDYDNDYESLFENIELKDWKHFEILEHLDKLLLLDVEKTNYRTIFFRGVENGIYVNYTFEKLNGKWNLTKMENYST